MNVIVEFAQMVDTLGDFVKVTVGTGLTVIGTKRWVGGQLVCAESYI